MLNRLRISFSILLVLTATHAKSWMWECNEPGGGKRFTNIAAEANGCPLVEWIPFADSAELVAAFNQKSFARSGKNWKLWAKWDYKKAVVMRESPHKPYQSNLRLLHYNCNERTVAEIEAIYFDAKGQQIHATQAKRKDQIDFKDVAPNTSAWDLMEWACRMASTFDKK